MFSQSTRRIAFILLLWVLLPGPVIAEDSTDTVGTENSTTIPRPENGSSSTTETTASTQIPPVPVPVEPISTGSTQNISTTSSTPIINDTTENGTDSTTTKGPQVSSTTTAESPGTSSSSTESPPTSSSSSSESPPTSSSSSSESPPTSSSSSESPIVISTSTVKPNPPDNGKPIDYIIWEILVAVLIITFLIYAILKTWSLYYGDKVLTCVIFDCVYNGILAVCVLTWRMIKTCIVWLCGKPPSTPRYKRSSLTDSTSNLARGAEVMSETYPLESYKF